MVAKVLCVWYRREPPTVLSDGSFTPLSNIKGFRGIFLILSRRDKIRAVNLLSARLKMDRGVSGEPDLVE